MLKRISLFFVPLVLVIACSQEHETESGVETNLPSKNIALKSLGDFQSVQDTNWRVAGNVYANRNQEQNMHADEGEGILVNLPSQQSENANLLTKFEHGDLDLELDFMMAKSSNSGIYLQGRYEVQLLDSWLKKDLTFQDCGAIYEGIEQADRYAGKKPLLNATKAPGLWQHLRIKFKAPTFDEAGKKITNARFVEVYLNNKLIQQNVEVTTPTLSAQFNDEKAVGPLMIQGDHGPVAFKNIRYKSYGRDKIVLKDIEYKVYAEKYRIGKDSLDEFTPEKTGKTDSLSQLLSNEHDHLWLHGSMEIPVEGDYLFEIKAAGPAWLYIDDKMIVNNEGVNESQHAYYGKQHLPPGSYSFRVIYANFGRSLSLGYEGPGIPKTYLTTVASTRYPWKPDPLDYLVTDRPKMLRGFFMHEGEKDPYNIAIGIPGGINYAYDLRNYNLLSAWHGKFLDVSEMWVSRGEPQLEQPLGANIELSGKPATSTLGWRDDWPDSVKTDANDGILKNRGYKIRKNGLPVFFYTRQNVQIEDYIHPTADMEGLTRELTFKSVNNKAIKDLYVLVGVGKKIEHLPDGSYAINDKTFYVDNLSGFEDEPEIKSQDGNDELVLKVKSAPAGDHTISYSIIW